MSSNQGVSWYIVLYEWQGAHDLSNCRDWHPSAEVFMSEDAARSLIDRYLKNQQPHPGKLTYRNIRGPFPWQECSPSETTAPVWKRMRNQVPANGTWIWWDYGKGLILQRAQDFASEDDGYWIEATPPLRSPEEPAGECVHNLIDCVSTLTVIDPYKAKCRVCYNFFDLPLDGSQSSENGDEKHE